MTRDSFAGADRLDLLQTFVCIVESGSLSAASLALGTSQPTVSRRLQALEKYLDVTLLQRSTHEMRLTEAGVRAFNHAKGFLETWQSCVAHMRDTHAPTRERLRVSVAQACDPAGILDAVAAFGARRPDVCVEWVTGDGPANFTAGDIDCAIQAGGGQAHGATHVPLRSEPRVAVAAWGLWGEGPTPRHASALAALPWAALKADDAHRATFSHDRSHEVVHVPVVPRVVGDNLQALTHAVAHGMGACVMPLWAVVDALRAGRLVHLAPEWSLAPMAVSLVLPEARVQPRRVREFVQVVREQVPKLDASFCDAQA